MAPRLSKRQQRALEELTALSGTPGLEPSSEEQVDDVHLAVPGKGGFAALMSEEVDDDDAGRKAKKPKKKKKKESGASTPAAPVQHADIEVAEEPTPAVPSSPSPAPATPAGPSKKERRALKKQKAKEKRGDVDEIEKALQELSTKYPDLKHATARSSPGTSQAAHSFASDLAGLLAVSLAHLDPEAELRKFFGKKVVEASRTSTSGPSTPGGGGRRTQRSNLTRPKPAWGPAQMREGLAVRALSEDEVAHKMEANKWEPLEERWWTVEYSKRYRGATMAFMETVYSGNPDGLFALYRRMPWHADTLMQLAEVQSHQEDHSQAADLIERALFTYERAFVGAFNFTSGSNRLDFDRVENRPFFLAIHRQLINLERRRVMRTTFEFARLLYSLDPWTDPHGALLWLDYLAIKAGMNQWLLDVYALFESQASEKGGPLRGRVAVLALPGWAYAKALALRARGGAKSAKESTEALKQAIMAFPSIVPLLADKADISLSGDVRSHSAFRIFVPSWSSSVSESILHLLSNIYAQRSFSIWKEPDLGSWLAQTTSSLVSTHDLPSSATAGAGHAALSALVSTAPNFAPSVYRHVLVLTAAVGGTNLAQRLRPFVPQAAFGTLACDPLPPPTKASEYDQAFFSGAEDVFASARGARLGQAATQRLLERLVPDPELRRQLQGIFDAIPAIRRQFPGGVAEFAQVAGQMPEDVLDELLMGAAMAADEQGQGQRGGMPGGLPEQDGVVQLEFLERDAEAEEEEEEDMGEHVEEPTENTQEEREDEEVSEEEEDEEDEAEEEYVAPMPVRILRNLVNRFWGTTATANEESDEEADAEGGHRHQ